MKPNRDGYSSFTTAGTVQTNPPILSPVAHCARRSQNTKIEEEDLPDLIQALNHHVASVGVQVVEVLFPPETAYLQRERRTMLDPPLFGSDDNYSFSTMQINISPLDKNDLSSLGSSGDSHVDIHDDPMSLSLIICMSYLKATTDPGKFYLGETRNWCALPPFSLLIFRGTGPHGGTQAIPVGEPNDFEKRITLILYPRKEFVNRTLDLLYPCYNSQQLTGYSFFNDGEACFGTKEYHQSWCSRELFRHMISENNKYGRKVDDSALQYAFTAFTGSTRQYIDRNSPQGKAIARSIADANELMESLRPHWQKNRQPAMIQGGPAPSTNSRGIYNQTTDPGVAETQPSKVPSETQSLRHSTRIKNPLAQLATSVTHDNKTSSEKVQRQRSPRKKKISDDDIPETHGEHCVADADDDAHSTAAPPTTSQSTLEILQGHPLFQLPVMNSELTNIERKAQALPFKFTNRTPQLGVLQTKQSSHLPPMTDGLTIVEQLIQLGERCHWVTQKCEHLWFYRRALDEYLISTLLVVEPLFDMDKLIHVFQNQYRNHGAGVCSSALLNKVESIVNRMMANAECPDNMEETELLDPVEILGEQYQPKFCAPVQVNLRPYAGKDSCKHMALHFREASDLLSSKSDVVDRVPHVFCPSVAFVCISIQ